ncbi:NmrA-like family [Phytophthora infestans]|uniref:NmrA-like family n=1 Tax=Phytophthora infestans TaxID=4787 RepID=A0A8S9UX29_PHYIN|nr:NmrA-like family [Phytophthora infestans]
MSTFTKFAVIGAGCVGSGIVDGLLNANASVTILTRDDAKVGRALAVQSPWCDARTGELRRRVVAKRALVGREVVVSSINSQHLASQLTFVQAAKAAGIQLFVPTEFGFREADGTNTVKQEVRDLLKKLELPFTLFHSGMWSEYLSFFLGYNFDEGFISVVGEGDAKLSIVTRADCSRFVAHVLVTATKSSLEGAQLSFESARVSPKDIAAQLEKKLGKKLQIKLVDYEETKKGYDTNPVAYIQTRIADGRGISGTEDEVKATIAKLFPDWNPSPWQEIIA